MGSLHSSPQAEDPSATNSITPTNYLWLEQVAAPPNVLRRRRPPSKLRLKVEASLNALERISDRATSGRSVKEQKVLDELLHFEQAWVSQIQASFISPFEGGPLISVHPTSQTALEAAKQGLPTLLRLSS